MLVAGCGGSDSSTPRDASESSPAADAPEVDTCALLTDAEVLAATDSEALSGSHQAAEVGEFAQCEWDPLGRGGNVVRVTLAYLPLSPDNISSQLDSSPAEEGRGEHVREHTSPHGELLEGVTGDSHLSLSFDDNAHLLDDGPGVARTLLKQAFAKLS